VVLESAKNRILGVDTPGQHVSPCIRYGMTCLLIRNAMGCVSYLIEWGIESYFVAILCESPEPHGARGDVCARTLSTVSGDRLFKKS
jgi:hypothetical protein